MTVVRLVRRPVGLPSPTEDFSVLSEPAPTPADVPAGHCLVKLLYLSMDPAMRGWMNASENSYLPPVPLGAVMRGAGVGLVVHSKSPLFADGDVVNCMEPGWSQMGVVNPRALVRIAPNPQIPLRAWASVLGGSGLTAYFGLLEVGQLQRGDVVVVSAAAGSVGSVAAQIAKHVYGCHVVGIAGGAERCDFLTRQLGLDAAVDYRAADLPAQLRRALPAKRLVDVFFDNVGGRVLDAVLKLMARKSRVVLCGAVSQMNSKPEPVANLMTLVVRSARMQGFVLMDYADRYAEAHAKLTEWILQRRIRIVDELVLGLERAPAAMLRLFGQGSSAKGKLIVSVFPEEEPPEDTPMGSDPRLLTPRSSPPRL